VPNSDYATYDPSGYYVYETLPLVRKQVLHTYGWFASVAAPFVVWGTYQNALAKKLGNEDRRRAMSRNGCNHFCIALFPATVGEAAESTGMEASESRASRVSGCVTSS